MGCLKITDLEYKSTSKIPQLIDKSNNTSTVNKTFSTLCWLGNNNTNVNNLIFVINDKYLAFLNKKFAKINSAKLYLSINVKLFVDKFKGVNLVYDSKCINTIYEIGDDYLIVDFTEILRKIMKVGDKNPKNFELNSNSSSQDFIVFNESNSYIEINYTPIGNSKTNKPFVEHGFGKIDLITGINNIKVFDIGCSAIGISHLYNSKRDVEEDYNCGKKWSLNINQKLLKDDSYSSSKLSTLYLYQDGTGNVEELEELFYINYHDRKIYVNKQDVEILDNGIIQYKYNGKLYIVNIEHITKNGMKLQTDITEYKKDISLELRSEEVATLEEQIKELEKQKADNKKSLDLLEKNHSLEELTKKIRKLENLLDDEELPQSMNNGYYQRYNILKKKILRIEKEFKKYLNEYYNVMYDDYDYVDSTKYLNVNIYNDFSEVQVVNEKLTDLQDISANDSEYQEYVNNSVKEQAVNEINISNYLNYLKSQLNKVMQLITREYQTSSDTVNQENYNLQKDTFNTNIDKIEQNLKIYKQKLEKLYRSNPVNYLISSNNEVYCFNIYGDLVNIVDKAGKQLKIDYFDKKIYRIFNDEEECLSFKYKNDLLIELKNNQGDKTTFTYDEFNNLIKIKSNDVVTYLYYDQNHMLTEILDDKYTGYKYYYNEDLEVIKMSEITYTIRIAEDTINDSEEAIIKNTVEIIYESLNKVTIYDRKGFDNNNIEIGLATSYIYDDDENIKYVETDYYDSSVGKIVKHRVAYDYVEKDHSLKVLIKDNDVNILKDEDFSSLKVNGDSYVLEGANKQNSIARIPIAKDRLTDSSYLILSVDAIANSFSVRNETLAYRSSTRELITEILPRFEVNFKTKYSNGEIYVQSQSFDWNIIEEQHLFFPVLVNPKYKKEYKNLSTTFPLLLDTKYEIEEYFIEINYNNNNDVLLFKNLKLQKGKFDYFKLNNDDLTILECDETNLYEKHYEYDEKLLLKEKVIMNNKEFSTSYHYDKDGVLLDSTNHRGIVTENTYNDNKIQTAVIKYHKNNPIFKFYEEKDVDELGNVITEKDSTGMFVTKYEYDKNNINVTKVISPNSSITHYYQTPDGKVSSQSKIINGQPNTNTKFYTKGLLTKFVNDKLKYNFEYDGFGRKTKVIIGDKPYLEISYNDSDKTKIIKYASNQGYKKTNNVNGDLVKLEYIDENDMLHPFVNMVYDDEGKIIKKQEFEDDLCYNESIYKYDESDNLICLECDNYNVESVYDNLNRLKEEIVTVDGIEEIYLYSYDDDDLIEITLPNSKVQTKIKDNYGRLKRLIYDNVEVDLTYKQVEDHLTNYVQEYKIAIPNNNIKYTYEYDEIGNIKVIKENNLEVASYEYDIASRLIKENNNLLDFTKIYEYDDMGNILLIKEYDYKNEETVRKTISREYDDFGRLTKYKNWLIPYDINNNPTLLMGKIIVFDKVKNLARYGNATFKYDTNGIRSEKKYGNVTTRYTTLNKKIIEERNDNYSIKYYYGLNGIVGFKCNDIYYTYLKDLMNNIVGILDEDANLVTTYVYDAWGNHIVYDSTGIENTDPTFIGNINPFRYRGYYYDVETNLFLVSSRYYSPELCRWISPDDIEYLDPESVNGLNLYCYCFNNPIMYIDPDGHSPKWLDCLLIAGMAAAAIALTIVSCGSASAAIAPLAFAYFGIAANTTLAITTAAAVVTSVGIAAFAVADIQSVITDGGSNYLSFLGGAYDGVKSAFYFASYMFGYAGQFAQPGWGRETRGKTDAPQYSHQYGKYIKETPKGNDVTIYNGRGQAIIRYDSSHIHNGMQPHTHYIKWWIYNKKWRWDGPRGTVVSN